MSVFDWLKCRFSNRGMALSLYRRGMASAKKHDHQGAIENYTSAIDMQDAPPDVTAMALYNRAIVHVAVGNDQEGINDLDLVLAMDVGAEKVKIMAKQKLARIISKSRKNTV